MVKSTKNFVAPSLKETFMLEIEMTCVLCTPTHFLGRFTNFVAIDMDGLAC